MQNKKHDIGFMLHFNSESDEEKKVLKKIQVVTKTVLAKMEPRKSSQQK